jgi:DNA-binding PadR family transcriptional regulator
MTSPVPKSSPIEMAVLGIVWKQGPCTSYSVMQELSASASAFVRSKAGSVYPLVARLVDSAFLCYEEGRRGSKGDRKLEITAAGLDRIQGWLMSPIPREDIAHTVDLIRMRSGYLGTLEPKDREQFVDRSLAGLREHLKRCEEREIHYLEAGDAFGALGVREMIHETRARIAWLDEERHAIMTLPSGKPARTLESIE